MSKTVRKYDQFQYYEEDCLCEYCQFAKRKNKNYKNGCRDDICRFRDIRQDAVAGGRAKRLPGWFRCRG